MVSLAIAEVLKSLDDLAALLCLRRLSRSESVLVCFVCSVENSFEL